MTALETLNQALDDLYEARRATPCQGRKSDRWTSEDYADLEWAAYHCRSLGCPVLQLCGEAADEMKTRHHTWGGTVRSPKPKRNAA